MGVVTSLQWAGDTDGQCRPLGATAANASSVMLSADVGSSTETCMKLQQSSSTLR